MNKRKQRGVALLFALGMLTILLISGMAFVANALTSHKVAANNSARARARIFAQSALSRVLASMMMYQYQLQKMTGDPPENFDAVQSYDESESSSSDGLTGDDSLLKLPADNSVISLGIAKQFNTNLAEKNTVKWVYFYDNTGDADDRKIIGRAAWKTISTSPQISAPVFLSGKLDVDGDSPNWKPSEHRWGREINEVFLSDTAAFLKPVSQDAINQAGYFVMQDYASIYQHLGIQSPGSENDAKKRFIDRWFMPDATSANCLESPTAFVPEVYVCKDDKGQQYPLMRFNISEVVAKDYGVSDGADPWYARFGIDSTKADDAANINNEDFLNKLTRNSQQLLNDRYDYDLKADERSGLPFLRRIGNDKGTFEDLVHLRKQIAANFNDYCDKDSVPTSDKPAETWMDPIEGNEPQGPTFTGNEKTPYIYELGLGMSVFSDENCKKNGLAVSQTSTRVTGNNFSAQVSGAYLGVFPIVKLANIYNFNPTETDFTAFTAGVDVVVSEIKFKPNVVTLEVKYDRKPLIGAVREETLLLSDVNVRGKTGLTTIIETDELIGTIEKDKFKTAILTVDDNGKIDNKNGQNPYPLIVPKELSDECNILAPANRKLNINSDINFSLTPNNFKSLALLYANKVISGTVTIKEVSVKAVSSLEITSLKFNIKRAYLAAMLNGKNTGLDYVKALPELSLTMTTGITGNSVKIPLQSGSNIPGMYVGGIRNYDPRQNLNPGDWYQKLQVAAGNDISKPLNDNSGINSVMKLSGSANAGWKGAVNAPVNNSEAEAAYFKPNSAGDNGDKENTDGPGWSDAAAGDDDKKHLSTAFIRNEPMMSPWEIGFIHRGVKWQTINLKNACDPENNSNNISLEGLQPFNGWTAAGTGYSGGDAAILDQIKMTDECITYGKININRLRRDDSLFNKEGADLNLEQYIAKALFENVRYNESISLFYTNSTRVNDALPHAASTGDRIESFNSNNLFDDRPALESRAAFVGYYSGGAKSLSNAFGSAEPGDTDAAQEEIIGKTINLLCAEESSPSQIKVVVVAQVIRDVAGIQVRNGVQSDSECKFGAFDPGYDDIIGEVKMLVTIERDVDTGRLRVCRTDYLE